MIIPLPYFVTHLLIAGALTQNNPDIVTDIALTNSNNTIEYTAMIAQLRARLRLDDSTTSRGLAFAVVGGISTIISVGIAEGLYLHTGAPLWLANLPAAQVAIFFKFGVNRSVTWQVKDHVWRRFWAHEGVCLIALGVQTVAIAIAASAWHAPSLIALGVGVAAGLLVNFAGNEFGVFKAIEMPSLGAAITPLIED